MRIKYVFLACLCLFSLRGYGETMLPADVFAKIQTAANMQPGEFLGFVVQPLSQVIPMDECHASKISK